MELRDSLVGYVRGLVSEAKLALFLSFPRDSLFRDPCVEELYQRHHMQHWLPRFDWSAVALFAWDVAANPPTRFFLVLRLYVSFLVVVLVHKVLFLVSRGRPVPWRRARGLLVCGFLLARGVVCHPIPSLSYGVETGDAEVLDFQSMDTAEGSIHSVQVASSLVGLGMTNLTVMLTLQLHTLDTLLLCLTNMLVCAIWCAVALSFSGASSQTLMGSTLFVAAVCVWHQQEQERYERNAFEQELLAARGMLLRSSTCLVRQGTKTDFNLSMSLLYRARAAELLSF